MKAVQPRAIAYIAVQVRRTLPLFSISSDFCSMKLRFALSSVESWRNTDANFDSDLFYNNIVSWFEHPKGDQAKARVQKALLWWNRYVYGLIRRCFRDCNFVCIGVSLDLRRQQIMDQCL